ncbi:bactoprenol glucosyl transferase, partial [Burkholderia cepacia]
QRPVYLVRRRYRANAHAGQQPARHAAQPDGSKLLQFPVRRVVTARRRQAAAVGVPVSRNLSVK